MCIVNEYGKWQLHGNVSHCRISMIYLAMNVKPNNFKTDHKRNEEKPRTIKKNKGKITREEANKISMGHKSIFVVIFQEYEIIPPIL